MTAQKIDGNALSQQLRADVTRRTMALKVKGITPGLAVVLVGDNPASQVYVRNKVKACQDSGLHSVLEKHPDSLSEAALLERIEALNADKTIHGILVQLPLPSHIDAQKVIEAISPAKDVDGFHIASAGALMTGMPRQCRCSHDRDARLLALHTLRLHEDAGKHRVRPQRKTRSDPWQKQYCG